MNNKYSSISLKNNSVTINKIFAFGISCFWIFALAVKKWMSASLFINLVISLFLLTKNKLDLFPENISKKWLIWLTISLAAPLLAVLFGQLFRQDFYLPDYDNVCRFFLAIPILYTLISHKINSISYFEYSIPIAIYITFFSILLMPNQNWAEDRLTTYFVDPILFGSLSLTLALMSLLAINLYKNDHLALKAFKLSGFLLGIYLSVISGSRTGWIAIPIVLVLWISTKFKGKDFLIATIVLIFFIKAFCLIPIVEQRINIAVDEISSYQWSSLNSPTSVGMRISFIRIGLFVFSHNMLAGCGHNGFKELLDAPELRQFANAYTRDFTLTAGFHNEIIANMVRSGIWGLISSLLIFLVPFGFFIKALGSKLSIIRNYALMALSYLICVFISSMSIEVFSSKLTASFHAIIMVNLIGSLLVMMSANPQLEKL